MKAPTVPGLAKEDALNGACPGCYYNGTGNTCSNRPPTTKQANAQPAVASGVEAESSSQAASVSFNHISVTLSLSNRFCKQRPHTAAKPATVASSNPNKKTNGKPVQAPKQSDSTLEKESGTGVLDANKLQQLLKEKTLLLAENKTLRQDNQSLQARVYELEDIIEAEEQQCMI